MNRQPSVKGSSRTLVIGDVHGCYFELVDLLEKAAVGLEDSIVFVGDLINRGPGNRQVLDFVRTRPRARSILGNHEYNLIQYYRGHTAELRDSYRQVIRELATDLDRYLEFISQFPYWLELDEAIIVHAGVRPGIPLHRQEPEDLVNLRTVEPGNTPWYEVYRGEKPIIFGHWVRLQPLFRKNVIGLDTGCVYGGRLSAAWLPGFEIISVPARKVYIHKADKAYLRAGVVE